MLLNILLVDDSEDDVIIAKRAFHEALLPSNMLIASDGAEALDYLNRSEQTSSNAEFPRPDLILLDINMPKLNGFEFLLKVKANNSYNNIPVIMLSSSMNAGDIDRSYRLGAAGFIRKPINYDEFVYIVEVFNDYWRTVCLLPRPKSQ